MDTSGNTPITVGVSSSSPGWVSATGVLTAGTPKYDLQYAGSGSQTTSVYAVSLYKYEA